LNSQIEIVSSYVFVSQENLGLQVFLTPQTMNVNGYGFHVMDLPLALANWAGFVTM